MAAPAIPSQKGGWGLPVALIALGAPPLIMGSLRLVTLAGVAEIPLDPARAAAAPLPVVVHIVTAAVFAVLGAFQFAAGFRAAGRAGTAPPGDSSSRAACWWASRASG